MNIDFSSKHDVLIWYEDGVLRPMDEPHYVSEKIAEGTWMISSSGDNHYLLEGEDEAIAIDTGYGAGNLREYLEGLCGKPVRRVINTHYHFDHSANNPYFDIAYAGAEDAPKLCQVWMYPSFEGMEFPRDFETEVVGDGSIVNLKGRDLEIFEIGDHTPGGIAILDRKMRILFVGDEFMLFGKMLHGSVKKWAADMAKLKKIKGAYDIVAGGFGVTTPDIIDDYITASEMVLAGERSEMKKTDGMKMEDNLPVVPGHKVYHWKMPHPEDRPGGRPQDKKDGTVDPHGEGKGGMECLLYKQYRFMFDPLK